MELKRAEQMMRSLMEEYGVDHLEFAFDRGKKRKGCTFFEFGVATKITLSKFFVELLPEEEMENTMRHEIAHALAGIRAGHGPEWKRVAREVGAIPKACTAASAAPEHAWKAKCPSGNDRGGFYRAPGRVRFCTCNDCKKRPQKDRVLTWYRNGIRVDAPSTKYANELRLLQRLGHA